MKKYVLLALSLISTLAFAANEGPMGLPQPLSQSYVVAETITYPGFVPPEYRFSSGVRIYSNGQVTSFKGPLTSSDHETEQNLTVLSSATLAKLTDSIGKISETELVDSHPGAPMCMDAGIMKYSVRKSSGAPELEIKKMSGCHTFWLKNQEGKDVAEKLDQLETLARKRSH